MKWEEESSSGMRRWAPFVTASLIINLLILWVMVDASSLERPERSERALGPKRLKLVDIPKTKRINETEEQKKAREKSEPLEDVAPVVNLPPDYRSERPDKAKFSATTDHKVEKETISRHQTPGYENAGHEKTRTEQSAPSAASRPPAEPQQEPTPESDSKPLDQPSTAEKSPSPDEERRQRDRDRIKIDLGPPTKFAGKYALPDAFLKQSPGQKRKAASGTEAEQPNLIPDFHVLADLNASPANDVVDDDIEVGEGTYLNTRKFKYASFFNRFHRSVSQQWNPIAEYRRRDPTGHVYGPRSRITLLEVELDSAGVLISSKVIRSSGLDFLDQEAMASLKRAQPFPNPPDGLLNDDRLFFSFGFQVRYGRR